MVAKRHSEPESTAENESPAIRGNDMTIKKPMTIFLVLLALSLVTGFCAADSAQNAAETASASQGVYLSDAQLYDKLLGGWIGQMAGVTWGAPTEFRWRGTIIPAEEFPAWQPEMINGGLRQDDLYVEIPFLDAMKENGAMCPPEKMAEKFRDSTFGLWHANYQGRENLRNGIPYPDSGHYRYNRHADDIDWQIECDFLGQMYPGLVNEAALRAFEVGHIMNYGDGVYGGVFITAMHAAAYTAGSIEEIARTGIDAVPEGTKFRTLVEEVFADWKEGKKWEEVWQILQDKWGEDDKCPGEDMAGPGNIDAKLNSGYVLIGLLWGGGNMDETIIISGRCGQDSDCNPSSAASILGNFLGASAIDEKYTQKLDRDGEKFAHTDYTFNGAVKLNYDLMTEVLSKNSAVREGEGWRLPARKEVQPVPFEQWTEE